MALAGRIEELPVAELLGFLSYNQKSGKLVLTRRDGQALVVMRAGRIAYAASTGVREALGNILVRRKLLDEETLNRALDIQTRSPDEVRLGSVLVKMGVLLPEQLERVIRDQTGAVIEELLTWSTGFFRFVVQDLENRGEVEVDLSDLLLTAGFSTQTILLEAAAKLDQREAAHLPLNGATLERILRGTRPLALGAERTLTFLQAAAEQLERGLLLVVQGDHVRPVGHFGPWGSGGESPREMRCALAEPSLLLEALFRRQALQGPPRAGDRALLERLGGSVAGEGLALPVPVAERVELLFYGDNPRSGRSITAVVELELQAIELGLEIERGALEHRLRELDRSRRLS